MHVLQRKYHLHNIFGQNSSETLLRMCQWETQSATLQAGCVVRSLQQYVHRSLPVIVHHCRMSKDTPLYSVHGEAVTNILGSIQEPKQILSVLSLSCNTWVHQSQSLIPTKTQINSKQSWSQMFFLVNIRCIFLLTHYYQSLVICLRTHL